MTKAELRALERVFVAEINGLLPFQSKAKIYRKLEEDGLIQSMTRKYGTGIFAANIVGYQLTHAGRYMYCSSVDEI